MNPIEQIELDSETPNGTSVQQNEVDILNLKINDLKNSLKNNSDEIHALLSRCRSAIMWTQGSSCFDPHTNVPGFEEWARLCFPIIQAINSFIDPSSTIKLRVWLDDNHIVREASDDAPFIKLDRVVEIEYTPPGNYMNEIYCLVLFKMGEIASTLVFSSIFSNSFSQKFFKTGSLIWPMTFRRKFLLASISIT